MVNFPSLTLQSLQIKLRQREFSSRELIEALLSYIERIEPQIQAWAWLDPALARQKAEHWDPQATATSLSGIPIGIKDIIATAGIPTRLGSPLFAEHVPTFSATVVEKLDAVPQPTEPALGPAPQGLASTGDVLFCKTWTLMGIPAITLPTGHTQTGLPLGTQLLGRWGEDEVLLRAALWCESVGIPTWQAPKL